MNANSTCALREALQVPGRRVAIGSSNWITTLVLTLTAVLFLAAVAPVMGVTCEDESELEGTLQSVDLGSEQFTVSGITFETDGDTEFEGAGDFAITLADLMIGSEVEVEFCPGTGGLPVATNVEIEDGDDDFGTEVSGVIESIDSGNQSLVVNSITIHTTSGTEYWLPGHHPIAFGDLAVGMNVEVSGQVQPDGSVVARKIHVEGEDDDDDDDDEDEAEVQGYIQSINGNTLVVAGTEVHVTGSTIILDINHNPIDVGDLNVGDHVKVTGNLNDAGVLIAKRIRISHPESDCEGTAEFSGPIDSIDVPGSSLTIEGNTVNVTASTRIKDENNNWITLAELEVGEVVNVEGSLVTAGVFDACMIRVRRNQHTPEHNIRIFGRITEIDETNSRIFINGVQVNVHDDTVIRTRRNEELTLADLELGQRAKATGRKVAQYEMDAFHIRVQEENHFPNDDHWVIGAVEAIDLPTSMTVAGRHVDLTSNPNVHGFDGNELTLENILVGDRVKASGGELDDGGIRAEEIGIRGSLITSINAGEESFEASNTNVLTTPATSFKDVFNLNIEFEDLVVGDLARIRGEMSDDATSLTATNVRLLAPVVFSPTYANFLPTVGTVTGGKPTVTANDNLNTFGFIELDTRAFKSDHNVIYEVRANVSSNQSDPTLVPDMRLRTSQETFQKSSYMVVESFGDGRLAAPPEGREYRHYYVPAVPPTGSLSYLDRWFADLDLVNLFGRNAASGSLTLQSIAVTEIPLERFRVVETLKTNEFVTSSESWFSGGAPGYFSLAIANSGLNGGLDLTASDRNTFGYWSGDTKVVAEPDTLYRGRFLVRTSCEDLDRVPTFRVRMNLSGFQLGSVVSLESVNGSDEMTDSIGRLYDCYFYVPSDAPTGETILAAVDLLNLKEDDEIGATISLDTFVLEKLAIDP